MCRSLIDMFGLYASRHAILYGLGASGPMKVGRELVREQKLVRAAEWQAAQGSFIWPRGLREQGHWGGKKGILLVEFRNLVEVE